MFTQKKPATTLRKLHSLHALPDGRAFTGKIEIGKARYQFTFTPQEASAPNGKLTLRGSVKVKPPTGSARTANQVTASLLATQGSIVSAPPVPKSLPTALQLEQPTRSLPATDATDEQSSVGVLYFKLSPLDGRALGVPLDLSAVQLNARLYATAEVERDFQWLVSALVLAKTEAQVTGYLAEINRLLKA